MNRFHQQNEHDSVCSCDQEGSVGTENSTDNSSRGSSSSRSSSRASRSPSPTLKSTSTTIRRRAATTVKKSNTPKHSTKNISSFPKQQNHDLNSTKSTNQRLATPTWSANVVFYPPSTKYWRIGRQWYDLSSFDHPGGKEILYLSRDRFEDATFAFEAHHHHYEKARKVLQQYLLPPKEQWLADQQILHRPRRDDTKNPPNSTTVHHDRQLDVQYSPQLLDHDAFYSVLRRRVARYLASTGCPHGEPTWECIGLYWTTLVLWTILMTTLYQTGQFILVVPTALLSAILGSFGHNWVHQPKYKHWGWALLSLDLVGFSSEGWWRDHVLHHHMWTNTPWDNHYRGTDPFIKTDPTADRNWFQQHVAPKVFHLILVFGTYGNYVTHLVHLLQGQETWSIGKPIFLLQHVLFYQKWGLYGLGLLLGLQAILGNYYFTIALMNHNAEHSLNVRSRNAARDWGHAQLISCSDWSVHLNFRQSAIYLWLNFHTVHHLFPKVDNSHHPAIHKILVETCEEFEIEYSHGDPWTIYNEMKHSFGTPLSYMQEVCVYAGG